MSGTVKCTSMWIMWTGAFQESSQSVARANTSRGKWLLLWLSPWYKMCRGNKMIPIPFKINHIKQPQFCEAQSNIVWAIPSLHLRGLAFPLQKRYVICTYVNWERKCKQENRGAHNFLFSLKYPLVLHRKHQHGENLYNINKLKAALKNDGVI